MNALLGPRGRMWPTWDWMQQACWTPALTLTPREAPRPSGGGTRGPLSSRERIWAAQVVEMKPEAQMLLYCGFSLQTAPETGTRLWLI